MSLRSFFRFEQPEVGRFLSPAEFKNIQDLVSGILNDPTASGRLRNIAQGVRNMVEISHDGAKPKGLNQSQLETLKQRLGELGITDMEMHRYINK